MGWGLIIKQVYVNVAGVFASAKGVGISKVTRAQVQDEYDEACQRVDDCRDHLLVLAAMTPPTHPEQRIEDAVWDIKQAASTIVDELAEAAVRRRLLAICIDDEDGYTCDSDNNWGKGN